MKRLLLLLLLLFGTVRAGVDIQLEPVSVLFNYPFTGRSTLVLDLRARSSDAPNSIGAFQASIHLDSLFQAQNPAVTFSNRYFSAITYCVTEDYDATQGRIRMVYTCRRDDYRSIGVEWITIVRMQILYESAESDLGVDWFCGEPDFFVLDNNINPVTGSAAAVQNPFRQSLISYYFPVAGVYLISVPGSNPDMRVATLFPFADRCFSYSNGGYSLVENLQVGEGYWLSIPKDHAPVTVSFGLIPVYEYTRHISAQGWCLTGSIFDPAVLSADPKASLVLPYRQYDSEIARYLPAEDIQPKLGYWIAVRRSCDVSATVQVMLPELPSLQKSAQFEIEWPDSLPPPPPIVADYPEHAGQPRIFDLQQNYPNPFNMETSLTFQVMNPAVIAIHIFNSAGQNVRTLVDGYCREGQHQVVWDGTDESGQQVGAGVYFVQMTAPGYSVQKKLVMIK